MDITKWLPLLFVSIVTGWMYDKKYGIRNLNADNFEKTINKPNRLTYVQFYKSSQPISEKAKKDWNEAALGLLGVATVAAIDCEIYSEICKKSSIDSFPSIHVYQGKYLEDYDGKIDKHSVGNDVDKRIPSSIEVITNKKMETFLKEKKSIPKAFFFGKFSDSILVRSLAMQLSNRMLIASIPETEKELVDKYSVKKFPTLMVIPVHDSNVDDAIPAPIFYSGLFAGPSIQPWLDARGLPDNSDDEVLDLIEKLTDDSCMEAICLQGGLCAILIISLDSSSPDISSLKEFLPMMNRLEDYQSWMLFRTKSLPQPLDAKYSFTWLDGTSQNQFIKEAFGLEPQNYPQLVVMDAKKLMYATFGSSFSFENAKEFLMNIRNKRDNLKPMDMKKVPHLVGDTTRCIGMNPPSEKKNDLPKKKKKTSKRGARGGKGPVKLGENNFNTKLVSSQGNWIVAFIDKEDTDFTTEWKKASLSLKNIVRFGIVNCAEGKNKKLADIYEINSFPTVKIFPAGLPKYQENVETYKGGFTSTEFINYANDMIEYGDDFVSEISKNNMMDWFQDDVDTPRLLFVTDEPIVPNRFKAAALEYTSDELMFGFTNDPKLAKSLRVTTFPALIMLSIQLGPDSQVAFRFKGAKDGEEHDVPVGRNRIPSKVLKSMNRLTKWCDNIVEQWMEFKKKHTEHSDEFDDDIWTAYDAPYAPEMDTFKGKMPHDEL